jgi:LEA14-like dessication related protein
MKKNWKTIVLLALLGVTGTTAIWLKKQYDKLMKNTYEIKTFLIKKASLEAVTFDIVYAYFNNTDIDINLVGQKYDIYVDDKFITTIKSDVPVVLKANATSDIPLTITVNPKDLYAKFQGNLIKALTTPQKLKIKMDSTFKVKLGLFTIPIPYPYEWTQGVPAILGKK